MKKYVLLLILSVLVLNNLSAGNPGWTDRPHTGKPLIHWFFSKDKTNWEEVSVPHSYNNIDGQSKSYYRGEAYYKTTLPASSGKGARYLIFEGVGQSAHVIADGDTLCYHSGAYTPFYVDITGKDYKQVEVACENRLNLDRIPLTSDFNKNGGIHYPVWLLECPEVHLSPEAHGFYRLHVSPLSVTEDLAAAQAKTLVCNASAKPRRIVVQWSLLDAEGKTVLTHKEKVTVPSGAEQDVVWDFKLTDPHLWNGLADPYLYTVKVAVGKDKAETEVGFRYFRMDPKEGFFLNGKSYPLRGVSMHQDLAGKATAMDKADIDRDMEIVREIGCNFLRLAHYPHNDYTFRLCDRMGIVVQTEIPWVNNCGTEISEAYVRNIYDQMTEMVSSLYNHPSIIFWGMWTELDKWGHTRYKVQGILDERRVADETARLYDFTKALDPYRMVGLTDDSVYENDYYSELKADFYSENRYHGWYYNYGKFDRMSRAMKKINEKMGVTNLSEYGVGVNPYCHTWNAEDIKRDKTDSLHFEEYGNRFHESHAAQIAESPYMNFTSLWVMFDFPVAEREEGIVDSEDGVNFTVAPERKYLNDKGIVTRDRKVFKDVFYMYKAWWNKDVETVYITARRLKYRPAGQEFVMTIYSNSPSLELFCNGVKVGEASKTEEPTGVVWTFNVKMGDGPTTFKAVSPNGTSDQIEILPLQDLKN